MERDPMRRRRRKTVGYIKSELNRLKQVIIPIIIKTMTLNIKNISFQELLYTTDETITQRKPPRKAL